ncbi:hypothetical protein BCR34DRAFT_608449 [Clohesyomyces aquaticus]|uniref:Uncharacterized protein n=1 Tax=Clohesyomyces aquaticus TaxID=1231657 RepID=A0A1Y1Y8F7_9PLEO|nr:hypothetical protein BCR34DRAFT_608449 [Clohesyomyces aquaticus]
MSRLIIYEFMDLPPVLDDWMGLLLSCRQPYEEMSHIAPRRFIDYIEKTIAGYGITLVKPIGIYSGIATLGSVTLGLSIWGVAARSYSPNAPNWRGRSWMKDLELLLCLRLEELTINFGESND